MKPVVELWNILTECHPHSQKLYGVRIADILTKMVYVKVAKVLLFKMMMIFAVMQKGVEDECTD